MKNKSLKSKVLWSFGTISFFMLLAFGFIFYYFLKQSMLETEKNNLYTQAYNIKEQLNTTLYEKIHSKIPFAIAKNNHIIFKSRRFDFKDIELSLKKKRTFFTQEFKDSLSAIYIMKFSEPYDGAIIIQKDEIDEEFEHVLSAIVILEPILFLLFLLLANKTVNTILKPIQDISAVAKKISIDNFHDEIPITQSHIEIKELIQTFNTMIQRLKEGVEKLDRFNSDVSHELRTPLTVIHGKIELALKKERDTGYYKESLDVIQSESTKIQNIVEDLLQLSRYSKENIAQDFARCDLNAILLEVIEKYLLFAKEKNINLKIVKFEKATRDANASLINTIFSNLIDNAIKYTPKEKNIYISLYTNNEIYFKIQDEGIGIDEDVLPKITDRFYRVDEARNKKIEGFGLGLSIVQNSVYLHDGVLNIESSLSSGTIVEVIL